MDVWYRNSTPYLRCDIVDEDGAAVDPVTSVKVTVYDPNGKVVVSDGTMTNTGTVGEYYYVSYTVPYTALSGIYSWIPRSVDGAIIIRKERFEFEVPEGYGTTG